VSRAGRCCKQLFHAAERELADGDPQAGVHVRVLDVLDEPPGEAKGLVDGLPGEGFGLEHLGI
jgi:hypothetical protein